MMMVVLLSQGIVFFGIREEKEKFSLRFTHVMRQS
jgi:hypothetical protein